MHFQCGWLGFTDALGYVMFKLVFAYYCLAAIRTMKVPCGSAIIVAFADEETCKTATSRPKLSTLLQRKLYTERNWGSEVRSS